MLPDFLSLCKQPVHLLSLGFGSGLAPKAPGTFGTLAAIPFFLLIMGLPLWLYVLTVLFAFVMGIYLCAATADYLGVHDHPAIVWDEFVGLWISLLPLVLLGFSWAGLLLGFALFRLFDIWKPWPIGYFDKTIHGGLGIMVDDVLAGIMAAICLFAFIEYI